MGFEVFDKRMAPLAKALRVRTGKDYLLYVLAVSCGGVITATKGSPFSR